ncbi:hypothetical protein [Algisphaera agarilytica]|uniref:Uncharacterized protein n=1 Tax=Algisphaera agarilytica TaxID=1385975 RepID=A0A7X0LJE2_9BACT|nr:hypothetical protein [Algisphaera agarilytica]MBB6428747.1 hypothetical protein [Algisphaera agarilytica]
MSDEGEPEFVQYYKKAVALLEDEIPLADSQLKKLNWFSKRKVNKAISLFEKVVEL